MSGLPYGHGKKDVDPQDIRWSLSLNSEGAFGLSRLAYSSVSLQECFCAFVTGLLKPGHEEGFAIDHELEEIPDRLWGDIPSWNRSEEILCRIPVEPSGLIRSAGEGKQIRVLCQHRVFLAFTSQDQVHPVAEQQ